MSHSPSLPSPSAESSPKRGRKGVILVFGAAVLLAGAGAFAWHSGRTRATHGTPHTALPVVAVVPVTREDLEETLTLSAEFRPYQQVALHAKVAGYLESIAVDVGDHVKAGQPIGELDVPEMQNEMEKARAAVSAAQSEVARAEAGATEAHMAFTRLQEVAQAHPKLVAQQELDVATARDATAASAVAVAQQKLAESHAEAGRLTAMYGYLKIVAPFDGVITKRYADPGALIQAGTASNTQAMPVVELAEEKRLRLTFPVPESAVPLVKEGAVVHVKVGALHETFDAKVSRFSGKVDRATRTMMTEVDVKSADGRYKPGMIAYVTLVTREAPQAITVPTEALTVGAQPSVMVVNADDTVEQRPVKLGLQAPARAEILEGLQPGDRVLVGSRSGVQPGQKITAKMITLAVNS